MERKDYFPMILAMCVIAVVLIGEVIVVTDSHDDFSSSISVDGDTVQYTIDPNGSHVYTAVSLNGALGTPKSVSVYYDTNYVSAAASGIASTGARPLDEGYYVEQIDDTLKVRGIDYSVIVDANELKRIMSSKGEGHAVIILSGSLPDTVYDGKDSSLVFEWLSSGGRLYWIGGVLGKYVSHQDSLETVENGTSKFLGSECIDDEVCRGYEAIDNGFRDAFYIQNNLLTYAVKTNELPADSGFLSLGYTDGERSSITTVKVGDGSVCVFGGEYSIRQRIDLAQMVASGIGPDTVIVDSVAGSASGTETGTLKRGGSVYITLGGFFPVYGSNHEVDV